MNTAKLITVIEKAHYPFKSYPRVACETVVFPGCSFPSQFPRTMDVLADACRKAGFGIAYDCCGEPLGSYGEQKSCERILHNVNKRLNKLGCKRLVVLCPNCHAHLEGKLDCETVSIYDVMNELDVKLPGSFAPGHLYIPCPDRKTRSSERKIRELCDLSAAPTMTKAPCCGLRADLASRGTDYVEKLSGIIIERASGGMIYTYCASCLGQFSRMGYNNCRHVVSALLGIDEQPDSNRALLNRAKRKLDKNTDPQHHADGDSL